MLDDYFVGKERKHIMETRNFLIRESIFDDYQYFAKWETDPEVIQYLSFDEDRTYEEVVTESLYNRFSAEKMDFTVIDRDSEKPVGRIYLSRIDKNLDSLDITRFYIGEKSMWGHGFGREILTELLE